MSKQKRIVCYAINGAGLGHVTRLLSVAKWMRRYVALLEQKPAEVLFLTSSDASDILAEAGFAAFKIPSKTIARRTELNKLEYRRLAKHFVWNTLGVFRPCICWLWILSHLEVLTSCFRSWMGRLRRVSFTVKSNQSMPRGLRFVRQQNVRHRRRSAFRRNCSIEQIGGKRIQFSGEVVQFEREDLLEPTIARQQLGVGDGDRLIYLSAGGGGDPNAESQLQSLVKAFAGFANAHLLIGAGPLYRGARISGRNVTWYDGPSIGKYFNAVDAAVSAAGYNTFHELLLAGVPTAFFAQEKIADDQLERIQAKVETGACRLVNDVHDVAELMRTLKELLDPDISAELKKECASAITQNGAKKCALQLLSPLYAPERLSWAEHVLTPRLANRLEKLNGSASAISEWLVPLMPHDQARSAITHPAMDSMLGQLSESAAAEVKSLLESSDDAIKQSEFETSLIRVLDKFDEFDPSQRNAIANETRRTILAAMKKHSVEGDWTTGATEIVLSIKAMMDCPDDVNEPSERARCVIETLQLYRTFPKLVDATAAESFGLFENLLAARRESGEIASQISQSLQLLKMKQQRVTSAMIRELIDASVSSSEVDLHG